MHDKENRLKAIKWGCPERIPISIGILPAAWMRYREALDAILARYPIAAAGHREQNRDYDCVEGTYVAGKHVDAWGCVWCNLHTGMEAIVTEHPVPTREAVHALEPPEEDEGFPHGFMFLRLADLRGFEELMLDFAEEPPALQMLIDVVRQYNVRQARLRLAEIEEEEAIVLFGDDLGMQNSLPISPGKWRKYLKPCFAEIFAPFCEAGHHVYLHSDGHIYEIIPDLIDCGVSVINPQIGANGLDNLVRTCKGRICVDLDLDRQMFPFWSPDEIDVHILEVVEKLGAPEGGLWLKAEIGDDVPLENIEAICAALEKYSLYYS